MLIRSRRLPREVGGADPFCVALPGPSFHSLSVLSTLCPLSVFSRSLSSRSLISVLSGLSTHTSRSACIRSPRPLRSGRSLAPRSRSCSFSRLIAGEVSPRPPDRVCAEPSSIARGAEGGGAEALAGVLTDEGSFSRTRSEGFSVAVLFTCVSFS